MKKRTYGTANPPTAGNAPPKTKIRFMMFLRSMSGTNAPSSTRPWAPGGSARRRPRPSPRGRPAPPSVATASLLHNLRGGRGLSVSSFLLSVARAAARASRRGGRNFLALRPTAIGRARSLCSFFRATNHGAATVRRRAVLEVATERQGAVRVANLARLALGLYSASQRRRALKIRRASLGQHRGHVVNHRGQQLFVRAPGWYSS